MISKSFLMFALALGASIASAVTYDAVADFSTAGNPNGAWSYGYRQGSVTDPFQLDTVVGNFSGFGPTWQPAVTARPVIGLHTGAFYDTAGTTLFFHPGVPGSEPVLADLRWTNPAAATVDLNATFFAGDSGHVDISIYHNSTLVFSVTDTLNPATVTQTLSMGAGDTLDFIVGTGSDGANSDTTPFIATINTSPVPEPFSVAALGLGLVVLARRRRKS